MINNLGLILIGYVTYRFLHQKVPIIQVHDQIPNTQNEVDITRWRYNFKHEPMTEIESEISQNLLS